MSGETHGNESIERVHRKVMPVKALELSAGRSRLPCCRRLRHQIKTDAASVACFSGRCRCMSHARQRWPELSAIGIASAGGGFGE